MATQTMPSLLDSVRLAEDEERLTDLRDDQLLDLARTLHRTLLGLAELSKEYEAAYRRYLDDVRKRLDGPVPLALTWRDLAAPLPPDLLAAEHRVQAALDRVVRRIKTRAIYSALRAMRQAAGPLWPLLIDAMEREGD